MCGIFGYIGKENVINVLIDGLKKMEYRGYDSSGVALKNVDIQVIKKEGKLACLLNDLQTYNLGNVSCGIGHTRWATHGAPSDLNAHPQSSNNKNISLVHNGIVENYLELKEFLSNRNYIFYSETDSEVVVNLIDYFYEREKNILTATQLAIKQLKGSFAIAVISKYNDSIIVAKHNAPLVIGENISGKYVASDIPALSTVCKYAFILKDDESAVLNRDGIVFFDCNDNIIIKDSLQISEKMEEITKGDFDSFMYKEILQIPLSVKSTYQFLSSSDNPLKNIPDNVLKKINKVYLVACGTAYHASLIGENLLEKYCRIPSKTIIASEFLYSSPIIDENTLTIAVSQSGETADTLGALKLAKSLGATTIAITNVLNSSICFVADYVLHTKAGLEIGVASTKAYNSQMIALICLANKIYYIKFGKLFNINISKLEEGLTKVLTSKSLEKISLDISKLKSMLFLGRDVDYITAMEASLKLKEISYIHSEALCCGELKHGTLALVEKGTVVLVFCTIKSLIDKTLNAISEVRTRGAKVICISCFAELKEHVDEFFKIDLVDEILMPILSIVPSQLIAYHTAQYLGYNPDLPRNLAKSVTVE